MSAVLRVRQPGLFTTVQDFGRPWYQHLGVPVSGALDPLSLRLANAVVGNRQDVAGLEFCYAGPELEVTGGAVRVVIGGPVDGRIEGRRSEPVPPFQSVLLLPGDILVVGGLNRSMCGYLAVESGFAITPVLGSLSTYTRAALGGHQGRALAAGDELPLARVAEPRQEVWLPSAAPSEAGPIRVVLGPDDHHFHQAAIETFLSSEYVVSQEADRIGLRLNGPPLSHCQPFEIPSQGTVNGTIQVPGTGKPIILLADRQTTGGYTKIATVVTADLPRVGRLQPGARLSFEAIAPADAVALARREAARFNALLRNIAPARTLPAADAAELLALNLVGGFVNALELD
jgi:UPF0271 protein